MNKYFEIFIYFSHKKTIYGDSLTEDEFDDLMKNFEDWGLSLPDKLFSRMAKGIDYVAFDTIAKGCVSNYISINHKELSELKNHIELHGSNSDTDNDEPFKK